jgi:nucleoside-diphosphate-sugar epimerase
MNVLITGGTGFVLSNVAHRIRDELPAAGLIVLDHGSDNRVADLAGGQVRLVRGDVRDEELLHSLSRDKPVTHVIHGAAISHNPSVERSDPDRFIDVNFNGTVTVLEWLRTLDSLRRFMFVSTGGVYGTASNLSPESIQPETGPFDPPELYAATKYAAELMVRRYADLFSLPACRVRPSDVFGRFEGPTRARSSMSLPYRIAVALLERRPLRVSQRSLLAGGDYIGVEDVADAFFKLLVAPSLPYDVFNVASGVWLSVAEIFATFGRVAPDFRYVVVPAEEAEVDFDPANRLARYNAYDISRMAELGWRPRPFAEQVANYLNWLRQAELKRCDE